MKGDSASILSIKDTLEKDTLQVDTVTILKVY